ncbi:M1 family metallopeptidase [Reichenbachiella carrageenanivorans]|uniref:M1 family metallopeptidase n=1 Tax=Reichenbachiella carrageenanivorans TaxID=2979869 RepID=A0ABY6CWH1_9BACT|nr:M1 family metallopeptidase [Reichenbachiella carrageenanivorans]UXX78218.1 M1 family metallopeptidase [Reichenbachiella carrageenanivorans]
MKRTAILLFTALSSIIILQSAQEIQHDTTYSRLDSLRGSITPERAWWDLTYYHLSMNVDPASKTLEGTNQVDYKVLSEYQVIQIDLQAPMELKGASQDGQNLKFTKEGPAHFIELVKKQKIGEVNSLLLSYGGQPLEAKNAPWDGGITWNKDNNGNDFIASSCQGIGASLWWPCKDHMYDEVDSMLMSITVPKHLIDVSNGRPRGVDDNKNGTKTYHWFVNNPINNYGVNINIGDYVHFGESYAGEKGKLDLDYYVLRDNLKKAKKQFKDAPRTLEALEYWFGPYPFYEDGYKLVEAPYLGMEHQSSVTYGNGYQNGYKGTDLSGTGWGLKWDYIIIHESGHEWFANNITYKDMADMWIHESFTTYSEGLFTEYFYGKAAGAEYIRGLRAGIDDTMPIIADYGVNAHGSGDMYPKGANMLHTLRQVVNDDAKWRNILRGLNETFYHQTVTTQQIEGFISEQADRDFQYVFDQYLRKSSLPVFEYILKDDHILYRWSGVVEGFDLPVKVSVDGVDIWLEANTGWQSIEVKQPKSLHIDPDFYVSTLNVMGS